jgi:hypothetical protein
MKTLGRFAALMALIAPLALASSLCPALAEGSLGSREAAPHAFGLAPLCWSPLSRESSGRLGARPDHPLLALEATSTFTGFTPEAPCSLVSLNEPERLAPASTALRPFPGHSTRWQFPSLGGSALTLTSPDALPSLRDPAEASSQEDTLRLFRSHW